MKSVKRRTMFCYLLKIVVSFGVSLLIFLLLMFLVSKH